jgi:diadenosine tetraphosphate (Ap4A) HIT family hydrolase
MRVRALAEPVEVEPPRSGEDAADCVACNTPDEAYIWVSERWRVRAMDRPTGLPMVLILECRSHLDLGDLPNLLAAELGVMTVRLERAIRSLDGVARVHVNRWGDGSAHLHMWFLARPYGRLQLRGTFLSLWDDILPVIPEQQWRENLALVAAWLAEFGGHANAEPPHIQWQSPSTLSESPLALTEDAATDDAATDDAVTHDAATETNASGDGTTAPRRPADLADLQSESSDRLSESSMGARYAKTGTMQDPADSAARAAAMATPEAESTAMVVPAAGPAARE